VITLTFTGGVNMDIAQLSMDMSTQNILSDVSVAVLKNSLDTMEDLGNGMTKMMESSVTPYLGQNIDYLV
jgi:hypothetical protein